MRKESLDHWLCEAKRLGVCETAREGKQVYRGDTFLFDSRDHLRRAVFEVTERTITRKGQTLLIPEVVVDTWWTSLDAPCEKVIELYHDHGTSEQFHSELKTDMDVERLPSGKFATNALLLLLAMIAYNLLRLFGQTALKMDADLAPEERAPMRRPVARRRLRSVILDLMYQAARLTRHQRRWGLSFARHNPWFSVWVMVYAALSCN